ncbi:hypothetical protein ACHHYP_01284 [Achlya hypogyna]|uniref:Uncharacterized protein n=1 Tax=Achlya hypogyna TaxID=1202772 RepID=A0A1V9Z8W9_ACHHY|nr:hypothetical protein ACHHYP_01284 [Achlya hypogyna]
MEVPQLVVNPLDFAVTSSASGKRVLLVSLDDVALETPSKRIKITLAPPPVDALKIITGNDDEDDSPRDVAADELLLPIWNYTSLLPEDDLVDDDVWLLDYFLS